VGKELTSGKLFLQPPTIDLRCLVYENPQDLVLEDVISVGNSADDIESIDQRSAYPEEKETTQSEIDDILDHIPQPSFLREVSTDHRIITDLAK
jgi:SWI/SNF-related matrix-associated actin-dependent regulator of chromatin subfamily A3